MGKTVGDEGGERLFDGLFVALGAAAAPFDAAVRAGHVRVGRDHHAAVIAFFMGDIGALSLGGALGAVAMATKHEIVLMIVGGLFVVETVSVIIQVFWFKRTGQRVFLMAPLHHHFEKKGWAEPTIVIRFWIISMILALVGLATLKIR